MKTLVISAFVCVAVISAFDADQMKAAFMNQPMMAQLQTKLENIKPMLENIKPQIQPMLDNIKPQIQPMIEKIQPMIAQAQDGSSNFATFLQGSGDSGQGFLSQIMAGANSKLPIMGNKMGVGPQMMGGMAAGGFGHGGAPLPTWLQGQNWDTIKEFFGIIMDKNTTIAQQKSAILSLAADVNATEKAQQFFKNMTDFKNALIQNVTEIVNQLPQVISEMQKIIQNEDQTREQMFDAIKELRNTTGKAFDVAVAIPMMLHGGSSGFAGAFGHGQGGHGHAGTMIGHIMGGKHGGHGAHGGMMHIMGGGHGHGGAGPMIAAVEQAPQSKAGKGGNKKKNNKKTTGNKKKTTTAKPKNKKKTTTVAAVDE